MYLTYLDESDTKSKAIPWKVMGAVLVQGESFIALEALSTYAIENLVKDGHEFTEFHAAEMYGGYGAFEGIEQSKRLETIEQLLYMIPNCGMKVAYGAVNLDHLKKMPYASANSLDIAFRLCAQGISQWLANQVLHQMLAKQNFANSMAVFIADECDKADKTVLQNSFRSMRTSFRVPPKDNETTQLSFVHDDIYFGDSRFSIGIQMADLCSYFIAKHLAGETKIDHFYKLIEPHIVSAAQEPE